MTTVRIPPLAADGVTGGTAACLVVVRLTDARGEPVTAIRVSDGAPLVTYIEHAIPPAGPTWEVALTPQTGIALPGGDPSFYTLEIRGVYHAQTWRVQVPDQPSVDLIDLIGASALAPTDLLSGLLLSASERAALSAAATPPSAENPLVTLADLPALLADMDLFGGTP